MTSYIRWYKWVLPIRTILRTVFISLCPSFHARLRGNKEFWQTNTNMCIMFSFLELREM